MISNNRAVFYNRKSENLFILNFEDYSWKNEIDIIKYRIVASTNTCYYSENQIFYSLE